MSTTHRTLAGLAAAFLLGGTVGVGLSGGPGHRTEAESAAATEPGPGRQPGESAPAAGPDRQAQSGAAEADRQPGQAAGQAGKPLDARGTIPPTAPQPGFPSSFAELAERLEPAVVNVQVSKVGPSAGSPFEGTPFEDWFRQRGGQPRQRVQGAGSGFVISPEGYIVTNNHVVEGAREVKVTFASGDEYAAKVVGRDPKVDLALVKIEPKGSLPSVTLGDSDRLRVGDWVLAIGNPFGLSGTLTAGIISAKGRVIGAGPYDDFLQTDAAINPGNSGGPLFNLRGEVVGINTAIVAGGQGVGFAIPVNLARTLLPQLKEEGRVTRAWLGVTIQPVTQALARSLGLKDAKGALVADVVDGGPAAKAGVKQGDVIVGIQGQPVEDATGLPRVVAGLKPGTKADVKIIRGGKTETTTATLGRMPDEEQEALAEGGEGGAGRLGLALSDVPRALARQLNIQSGRGTLVTAVEPGSPAERAGLRPGDVVLEVNRQPISGVDSAAQAFKRAPAGEPLLLRFAREGGQAYAALEPREPAGRSR